ncbi:hypothetical protein QJQ45_026474, partial [Haematococcus lacustris]
GAGREAGAAARRSRKCDHGIIRVRPAAPHTCRGLQACLLPLAAAVGAADFYPATSGKVRAAQYLMGRFRATPHSCTFMCDDDNDMELAAVVAKAFLPTVTSESVRQAVAQRPGQFVVARAKGTTATEEMLDAVARHYGLQGEGGGEGQGQGTGRGGGAGRGWPGGGGDW